MNYYKSTSHPFTFTQLTVNGDYFYYSTEQVTSDEQITEEQFNEELAKEIHVEWTPSTEPTQLDRIETQLDDADTIQAELLFNQANADVDTQLILETLAEILLNQQGV